MRQTPRGGRLWAAPGGEEAQTPPTEQTVQDPALRGERSPLLHQRYHISAGRLPAGVPRSAPARRASKLSVSDLNALSSAWNCGERRVSSRKSMPMPGLQRARLRILRLVEGALCSLDKSLGAARRRASRASRRCTAMRLQCMRVSGAMLARVEKRRRRSHTAPRGVVRISRSTRRLLEHVQQARPRIARQARESSPGHQCCGCIQHDVSPRRGARNAPGVRGNERAPETPAMPARSI